MNMSLTKKRKDAAAKVDKNKFYFFEYFIFNIILTMVLINYYLQ